MNLRREIAVSDLLGRDFPVGFMKVLDRVSSGSVSPTNTNLNPRRLSNYNRKNGVRAVHALSQACMAAFGAVMAKSRATITDVLIARQGNEFRRKEILLDTIQNKLYILPNREPLGPEAVGFGEETFS
ncbi:MAG: hypothetical protein ACRD8A_16320 [Candidatus Acidiferrales bacterium]